MPTTLKENPFSLHRRIKRGLPFGAFHKLQAESGLRTSQVAAVVHVPARTLERRRQAGRFSPAESDRLLRLKRLVELALGTFHGNRDAAKAWLAKRHFALGDETPLELATTEIGARQVEDALLGIQAGVYA